MRQNPKENSFFVQGLKKVPVGSYKEIEKRTDEGKQSCFFLLLLLRLGGARVDCTYFAHEEHIIIVTYGRLVKLWLIVLCT